MRALTVYQPWASLECIGLKGTETRAWGTRYRGPLLIHAGVRWTREEIAALGRIVGYLSRIEDGPQLPEKLPFGAVLALSELLDCVQVTRDNETSFSEFDRVAGDLSLGRWVWILGEPKPLREPIRCRGAQGLWTPGDELLAQIRRVR